MTDAERDRQISLLNRLIPAHTLAIQEAKRAMKKAPKLDDFVKAQRRVRELEVRLALYQVELFDLVDFPKVDVTFDGLRQN